MALPTVEQSLIGAALRCLFSHRAAASQVLKPHDNYVVA